MREGMEVNKRMRDETDESFSRLTCVVLEVLVLEPLRLWICDALVLDMLAFYVYGVSLFFRCFFGKVYKLITAVTQMALRGEVGLV